MSEEQKTREQELQEIKQRIAKREAEEEEQERRRKFEEQHRQVCKWEYGMHGEEFFRAVVEVTLYPYRYKLRIKIEDWTDKIYDDILLIMKFSYGEISLPHKAKDTYFNRCRYNILDNVKFLGLLPCSGEEDWYDDTTREHNPQFQKYNPNYTKSNLTIKEQTNQ